MIVGFASFVMLGIIIIKSTSLLRIVIVKGKVIVAGVVTVEFCIKYVFSKAIAIALKTRDMSNHKPLVDGRW